MPPSVFPIYGFILKSNILLKYTENDDVEEFIETFCSKFKTAVLYEDCNDLKRFITCFYLYVLTRKNPTKEKFNSNCIKIFLNSLENLLDELAQKIFTPILYHFEVLCNKFATAKLEVLFRIVLTIDRMISKQLNCISMKVK